MGTMTSPSATPACPLPATRPSRVIIEGVAPEVDGGQFPIKRTPGAEVVVEADVFAEGHDVLAGVLRYRRAGADDWEETPLVPLVNDRWTGRFTITDLGEYEYTLEAWVDLFATWRKELSKKAGAGQDVASELLEGAELIRHTADRAAGSDAAALRAAAAGLARPGEQATRIEASLDPALAEIMARHPDRSGAAEYERVLRVVVEQERARYGAWYEVFPRSCAAEPGRHGTLRDCELRLPYIAAMGFDVLYLPPVHPVGRQFRKGPNNTLTAGPDDPGSPWAIGGPEGGHKAINPQLGTFDDFDHLVAAASRRGIAVAMDIAFQCSPDHPYVREHPEWFRHRPDGTIKYAENPPKKYQDIYPLNFENENWQGLWQELLDVFLFWCRRGVRIFRVDNPHTKPFRFWDWVIPAVHASYPDAVFLSEAFTRPKVMRRLAKGGFSQSYTYFTWRNNKAELTEYFTELTQTEVREYMRPNLFANTPDILPEFLWHKGRSAFQMRLVLAATLGATYGIYGPPFEHCESRPLGQGEEYLNSEKYQVRHWDWDAPNAFRDFIARVNHIRRDNAALHYDHRLRFHPVDNDQLLFYSKTTSDLSDVILVVVNLDPHHTQAGWVTMPLAEVKLEPWDSYQVHDLLTDARYVWRGERNFVMLDPDVCPAHIFRLRRRVASAGAFDQYE